MYIQGLPKKHKNRSASEKGVVLLIAVIISSLVLVIGIGILNILTKEIVLSSLGKNSRTAFFAADAGVECAMHWDLVNIVAANNGASDPGLYPMSVFATSTNMVNGFTSFNQIYYDGSSGVSYAVGGDDRFDPFCAGQDAVAVFDSGQISTRFSRSVAQQSGSEYITRFYFFPDGPTATDDDPCTLVTITKELVGGRTNTTIVSEGFSSCNTSDVRRVSRGIRVDYQI